MLSQLLLAAALSATTGPDVATRDGLLTEAAAVPERGTVRLSTGGGATVTSDGGTGEPVVGVSGLWSMGGRFAGAVEASQAGGSFAPAVSLRYQLLSQEDAPLNGAVLLRFKSVGFRQAGNELEAELMASRTLGRLCLTLDGVVGKGFAGEEAVDVEGKAGLAWSFSETRRLGVEARLRAEVALGAETAPPPGREYDLIAGPALVWRLERFTLQGIGGVGVPRGTGSPGPVGMLLLSYDL
jgi:hypothetical protein